MSGSTSNALIKSVDSQAVIRKVNTLVIDEDLIFNAAGGRGNTHTITGNLSNSTSRVESAFIVKEIVTWIASPTGAG